jgi:hypothetical protein
MKQLFVRAWLFCGTLDALYATILTKIRGGNVYETWTGVAAGPFGDGANAWGWSGVLAGLCVHFAIMAAMVCAYLYAWSRIKAVREGNVWLLAIIYGVLTYGIMYGVVLHMRWPEYYPSTDLTKITLGLAPHILFVGIPVALMARRMGGAEVS